MSLQWRKPLKPLVEVNNISKLFPLSKNILMKSRNFVHAVDDVSFSIMENETVGLVGESGCGKSTIARLILRLLKPTTGTIKFDNNDISKISNYRMKEFRKAMQIIFQDPYSSLNPRMTVLDIIGSGMRTHGLVPNRRAMTREVETLLEQVGLSGDYINRYPHEFSGGQRQRIGIARALALKPRLVVCDEPVSALDVSVQAQIINLLGDLKSSMGLSYLFIAHDLAVVRHVSERIIVMYLGKIMEMGKTDEIFKNPLHPYTKALISAIPVPDPSRKSERIILSGDVQTPVNPAPGCRFASRCFMARPECRDVTPPEKEIEPGHISSCLFASELLQ
jgi:oligopeptide/dipeptide ABC transporter ATP-binding protein